MAAAKHRELELPSQLVRPALALFWIEQLPERHRAVYAMFGTRSLELATGKNAVFCEAQHR